MHSHISIVNNAQAEYIIDTTFDQCKNMHQTGTLIINVSNIIHVLKTNYTTSFFNYFCGISNYGWTMFRSAIDPYGTWQNVVVQGIITISLNSYQANKFRNNQIHLKSGTICQYSDANCIDWGEIHILEYNTCG